MALTRRNEQFIPPANAGQSGRGGVSAADLDPLIRRIRENAHRLARLREEVAERLTAHRAANRAKDARHPMGGAP